MREKYQHIKIGDIKEYKKMREKLKHSKTVLWWIGLITGLFLFFTIIIRSVSANVEAQWGLVGMYWVVLIIFITIKEVVRRTDNECDIRLGQTFVIIWWAVLMVMLAVNYILDWINITLWRLMIPEELYATFFGVVISYGISEFFKQRFLGKQNNNIEKQENN